MKLTQAISAAPGNLPLFDGGMGSLIAARGLSAPGQVSDMLVLTNPQAITEIQAEYVAAGSDIITTATFNSNINNLGSEETVAAVFAAAVKCARDAGASYVSADIGPIGELLEPYGDLEEDEAYEIFAQQVRAAAAAGADFISIETMMDLNEAVIALKAAKAESDLPVICSMSFQANGFTMFGNTPEAAVQTLAELGADAVGMNCSTGPEDMIPLVARMRAVTDLPIIAQPNAGLPKTGADGKATYDMDPDTYAGYMKEIIGAGATLLGGCCGTNPDFIRAISALR